MGEQDVPKQRGPYATILASRLRSQQVYGVSFTLDVAASMLFGLIEFVEVWIVFHNVRSLGGLSFEQVCLLFGMSHGAYSVSQVLVGHVDSLPLFLREGTLDAFYLRPLSILGQLMTSEIALRRLGWVTVGVGALGYGLSANPIDWSPATVLLLVLCLVSGIAIFCGIFVAAAACQFFLIDGAELTSAFTYGGRYASQQPTSIFPPYLVGIFVLAVPVAFTGYVPALALLGLDAPEQLPWLLPELAWASPLVAAWVWLVVAGLWRLGVRHYQGGGG
ncbi:ABC transporter permease [Austwickia chelonae]|uniref:ABC transporter permease protein n=1 Tax=Austwickia chelonae NBRC 105200 TaxID=1184607 RepID=K6UL44_9MICO|nr:ABC-2 family transporter protein [Austwickia chelonae]GAB76921.1 hypothetical protein AUCHE_03_01380 [Austwickia chelonae NBRC 105200]